MPLQLDSFQLGQREARWLNFASLLFCLSRLHVRNAPYTKVEESFTIQAVHDILAYGLSPRSLHLYDHHAFPGAVPRSFIGPLLVAAIAAPYVALVGLFGAVKSSADVQNAVRTILPVVSHWAIASFAEAVFPAVPGADLPDVDDKRNLPSGRPFTARVRRCNRLGWWFFSLFTACQFHGNFWLSRTVPNTIAFPFVLSALTLLIKSIRNHVRDPFGARRSARAALALLVFSATVLRVEIVGLVAPAVLWLFLSGKLGLIELFSTVALSGLSSLLATTVVDTYFWQTCVATASGPTEVRSVMGAYLHSLSLLVQRKGRPLWPEFEAVLFNVVQGKSTEWGVSPWHAYFSEHLFKLLSFSLPILALGLSALFYGHGASMQTPTWPVLAFLPLSHIAMLSLLGHKEWRFIMYCMPCLNAVTAIGAAKCFDIGRGAGKVAARTLVFAVLGLTLASTLLASVASRYNYPGGDALAKLHQELDTPAGRNSNVRLHIDVLPAMTGVTLFQSLRLDRSESAKRRWNQSPAATWTYDKTEDLPVHGEAGATAWQGYTHLLTGQRDCQILREVPELHLLRLPSEAGGKATTESVKTDPLPEASQPFETLLEPVSAFAGLRRKSIGRIASELVGLARLVTDGSNWNKAGLWRLVAAVLPIEIVLEEQVWICVKKAI